MSRHVIVFILIATLYHFGTIKPEGTPVTTDGEGWTVYGTMGCGWTRKQLDHMKNKSIPHIFVDCDKEDCGKMDGFPTLKDPIGNMSTGFKEV
tara:strand:- start:13432 stop:13710 length:279 start_codon:yes stop_codon:yes gene_type:complete